MRNAELARIYGRILIDSNGCWIYQGGTSSSGYGIVSVRDQSIGAHRVSYELAYGSFDRSLCVLHRCDNRRCINPIHLFLGTLGDNNTDRKTKGRNAIREGEHNTMAKLTSEQVLRIRNLYASSRFSQRVLAAMFGVRQQYISAIVRGTAWAHLNKEIV